MVYASIERAPVLGGTLNRLTIPRRRRSAALQQTVVLDAAQPPYIFHALGGVAVIANNTWSAVQGRKQLEVEWNSGPNAIFQSETYKSDLIAKAQQPQKVVRKTAMWKAD